MRHVRIVEGPLRGEATTLLHALVLDDEAFEAFELMRCALESIRDMPITSTAATTMQHIATEALGSRDTRHAWDVQRNRNGA